MTQPAHKIRFGNLHVTRTTTSGVAPWRAFFADTSKVRCETVETYTACRTLDVGTPEPASNPTP